MQKFGQLAKDPVFPCAGPTVDDHQPCTIPWLDGELCDQIVWKIEVKLRGTHAGQPPGHFLSRENSLSGGPHGTHRV